MGRSRIPVADGLVALTDEGYQACDSCGSTGCCATSDRYRVLHDERDAAIAERDQLDAIIADTNSAITRAGIFCAFTFAGAVDHLAAERDRSKAELHRLRLALTITCRWFLGIEADVLTAEQRVKLAEFRKMGEGDCK